MYDQTGWYRTFFMFIMCFTIIIVLTANDCSRVNFSAISTSFSRDKRSFDWRSWRAVS